ncbi:DUF6141 family protein [Kaarinaea lacus]
MEFQEIQRFTQRWFWIILIFVMLTLVGVFANGMIEQLMHGNPWGVRPVTNSTLMIIGGAVVVFSTSMVYLFYTLRLITEVKEEGLYIRFYPFRTKVIPFNTIQSCEARTYNPLSEYGGWGIKYGRSGWAYNIIGDRGVQLVLNNGKRILIGSQKAEELANAIKRFMEAK